MKSLTKQELKNIVEGKRTTERIPNLCTFWMGPENFVGRVEEMREWLDNAVYDIDVQPVHVPDVTKGTPEDPTYCWLPTQREVMESVGLDSCNYLDDWENEELIEAFYANFPSPESVSVFKPKQADHSKYVVAQWFYCLFERHWSLRGMENALTDFFLYPEEVHRLYQRLTDFYIRIIERAKFEYNVDAIFTSDDIGTQTGPFFSLEIFREFFKPYYKQMIDRAHELGMHFWLHTCGNVELFLNDFIEIGLDVIHPIQRHTMDEKHIAEEYGSRICILAGFDVQQVIPFGTPEEVKAEARYLIDTFSRPDGRFMITMGNGATPDWKPESIWALYEEIAKGDGIGEQE